jgi:PST family polysaccharide transporter
MLNRLAQVGRKFNLEERKIISNTGWLFAGNLFRIAINLWVNTWVARYLAPEQFGILQYALAFCSFFVPLSTAQMAPIITRDLVRSPDTRNQILGTAFVLQLMGGSVAAALVISVSFLLSADNPLMRLLIVILSLQFIINSFQPIENWFEAQTESRFTVLANNIAFVIATALKIILILTEAALINFAILIIVELLISAVGLIFYYQKDNQSVLAWRTNFQHLYTLLKESFPLLLSSTACVLYLNIDRVMLGSMVGDRAVGIYSSAATLIEALSFFPLIICSSLYPTIIQSRNLDQEIYQARLQKLYDFISIVAYGLILLLFPLSGFIIQTLYGESYQLATPIFAIYLWSCIFNFLGIAQSKWIVNEGLQKFNFYSRLAGLVSNVGLNLILIPLYQGLGAAIATVISYAIGGYLYFFLIPETRSNAILMTKAIGLPLRWLTAK